MTSNLVISIIILLLESLAVVVYYYLGKWNSSKERKNKIDFNSVIKGLLERSFLTFALVANISEALTVFAALKIATRIKDDHKISNDFYLMGIYSQLPKQFFTQN